MAMTKKLTFLALILLAGAVAWAAAQSRIEVRKEGASTTLVAGGRPVAAIVPFAEKDFTAEDRVREIGPGLFEWTRTFRYGGASYVRPARLTMEVEALYASRYSLIPAVMYDGNAWGKGLEPKGFVKDGRPWTFAYHRTSIPGATYSESEAWSVALFSAPGQLVGGFSCSLEPRADRTVHRLIWPEEETPQVYAMRDAYADAYRGDLRVSPGQTIELKAWIVVAEVKTPRHGWHALVDAAWSLNARPAKPRFEPEELWELGVQYAADNLWAEEKGFRGFSIGLGWDPQEQGWVQRQSWKYEIGWAGQNISLANSMLHDYVLSNERRSLDKGIACLDTWLKNARLPNGLFRCHYDYVIGLEDPKTEVQDACNLGQAAQGYFEAYDLAARCGLKKPEYRAAALGVCDFALKAMTAEGRIGKAWTSTGKVVDPDGTIGAFLIPPLATAFRATHKPAYLEGAERAFAFYINDFLKKGFTTAGALDTYCIDKESATPLLKGALELYDVTGKSQYLQWAEDVSYYLATWQWHYSVPFAEGTVLRELGYDTYGGTAVSTQHHHLDPYALIIVNDWIKLAQLTGHAVWKARAAAAWANGTIGISGGDLVVMSKKRPYGSQDEGFLHTRWLQPFSVSQWLVAWPTAFRLETLRQNPNWAVFNKN
jgi:hypothetical protein